MNSHDPPLTTKPREEAIFHAALPLRDLERKNFLDRECADDLALRRRLEALLEAGVATHGPLDSEPGGPAPTVKLFPGREIGEAPGQVIGRYRLLDLLGEGGGGAVYVAEQTVPVRRKVALKVLKLGMDTREVIARFEAERQALAILDHPNIAKVLDAGATETGRPYFVMELVRGIRITDYCDQARLPIEGRIKLFIEVCLAIQHAHHKGIIHRDIKPSNTLVCLQDTRAVPKVIDFGIAKAIQGRLGESTVYTQLHQFIGTPAYMSPEQAEMSGLDIDTRADVYSLGVLLYELLVGEPPFSATQLIASGLDAMRRTIREQEPERPSLRLANLDDAVIETVAAVRSLEAGRLLRQVRGDLDWIVMRCLEKDRTRRYQTANGLAMDLQRYLEHQPVVARPPSTLYRLGKAWRRNRLAFAAGGAVVLGLVVAVIGLAVALAGKQEVFEAQEAREKARQEARMETLRAEAVASFVVGLLEDSVNTMHPQGNTRGMRSLFEAADALTAARLSNSPPAELTVRATLWRFYSRVLNEHGAAARQATRLRELLPALAGRKIFVPGLLPDASGEPPVPPQDYLRLHALGSQLWAGQTDEARSDLEKLRAEFLSRHPPASNSIALALSTEGFCLHAMDRDAEAEPLLNQAFNLAPKLAGFFYSDQPGLTYARTLARLGKHEEAQRAVRESLRWQTSKTSLSAFDCYALLAESLCRQGKFEEAQELVENGITAAAKEKATAEEILRLRTLSWVVRAQAGAWPEAASFLAGVAANEKSSPAAWWLGAAACLGLADEGAYKALRRQAIWRFGAAAETEAALFLSMGLLLSPAFEDPSAVESLLQRLEPVHQQHWSGAFYPLLRALADYRSGRPQEALLQLDAWQALRETAPVRAALLRDEVAGPVQQFWRALILADLGRAEEARNAFSEGNRRLSTGPPPAWDLLQSTATLYASHALKREATLRLSEQGTARASNR